MGELFCRLFYFYCVFEVLAYIVMEIVLYRTSSTLHKPLTQLQPHSHLILLQILANHVNHPILRLLYKFRRRVPRLHLHLFYCCQSGRRFLG